VLPTKHILWDCEWEFGARTVPAVRVSFFPGVWALWILNMQLVAAITPFA